MRRLLLRSRWLCLAAGLAFGVVAHAAEPFGFKGFPLDGSLAEFRAKFPDFNCDGGTCRWILGVSCPAGKDRSCIERNTYGGLVPEFVTAKFTDDRLQHVMVSYSSKHFPMLSQALIDRLGEPASRMDKPVRTKAGVEYVNSTLSWSRDGAEIMIARFGLNVTRGYVVIETGAYRAARLEEVKGQRRDASKDL